MGIAERRTRQKEELRSKIMDAATELFVKEGFRSVSMRKIADRIEYAPSTIYLYFADKQQLMASIVEDVFDQLSERLEAKKRLNLPPLEHLFTGIQIYIQFGLEHPNHYYLAFCSLPDTDLTGDTCKALQTASLECLQHLAEALGRCVAAGVIPQQDLQLLTQTTWMLMHGVTSALIFKDHDPGFPWSPTEQVIEKALEILRHGILRPVPSKN